MSQFKASQTLLNPNEIPPHLLLKLQQRQRFVYNGMSYSPDTSEDENDDENKNEQKIVEESDEEGCEVARNPSPFKEEDVQKVSTFTFSPICAVNQPENTSKVAENEYRYPDESSIPSYTISQSFLDAFIPPGRTPVPSDAEDEEEKISETANIRETFNQGTSKSAEIEAPNCFEDKSREISKDPSNQDMEIDQSLMPEAKADSPVPSSSNAEAPTEQRNTIFQSQPSHLAILLLPRFFQPTTSAPSSQTTNQHISLLLPSAVKKTIPEWQQRETSQQPPERIPLRSRKTKGLYGKVPDQSLNAANFPTLDVSQSKEFLPRSSGGKRIHPSTPPQPKPTSKFGISNKEYSNRTKAFDLLQQYQSPVTPRVAPKRIAQNSMLPGPSQFNKLQPVETSRLHHRSTALNDPESQINQDFGKLASADEKESSGSHSDVKTITPNTPPSENVLEDIVLQTPSPPKETSSPQEEIPESPIDHDFGNDSFGGNESSRRSIRLNEVSPITTAHAFGDSSVNDDEISTRPRRSIDTNDVALVSVNNDSENVEDHQNNSNHSIPAQNASIPFVQQNQSGGKESTAIKKKNVALNFEQKPQLIKPNSPPSDQPFVRRTQRTRVQALGLDAFDLGEKAIYKYDENGLATLVDIKINEKNYAHGGASQNNGGQKGKRKGRKATKKK
uniref:Uncharacterized protein n=1 Tax=Panagrolaimus davidi TaxID=227884 RepID=A0A914PRF4_9BILA